MVLYHYQALTAPVGLTDPPPTAPGLWYAQTVRGRVPPRWPQREALVLGFFEEEPPGIEQWGLVESRQVPRTRGQRSVLTLTLGALLPAPLVSGVDQWGWQQPHPILPRRPQRDTTAHTLLSGFEATPVTEWGWIDQRRTYGVVRTGPYREMYTVPIPVGGLLELPGPDGFTRGLTSATLAAIPGASVLSITGLAPAGYRVLGLATTITAAFGTSGGLTGLLLGDPVLEDRWGLQDALLTGARTNQGDAHSDTEPIAGAGGYTLLIAVEGGAMDASGRIHVTLFWEWLAADGG